MCPSCSYKRTSERYRGRSGSGPALTSALFPGSAVQVNRWLARYPNTYFGLAYSVVRAGLRQRAGIRAIPLNRLLLESNSPYLQPRGHKSSHHALLGLTAREVAIIRGVPYRDILGYSFMNVGLSATKKVYTVCIFFAFS